MNRIDWLTIIILGLMIGSVLIALQFYYNKKVNECISNPLVYASKMYEENYGYFFTGSGSFLIEGGGSPIFYFSRDGITIKYLEQDIMYNQFNLSDLKINP